VRIEMTPREIQIVQSMNESSSFRRPASLFEVHCPGRGAPAIIRYSSKRDSNARKPQGSDSSKPCFQRDLSTTAGSRVVDDFERDCKRDSMPI